MRDKIFLKLFWNRDTRVTEEEVKYFSEHPEEIDDFSAPLNIHKMFLMFGIFLGVLLLAISKLIKYEIIEIFSSILLSELIIDLVFEIGVALIGAAVTAYLLGVLLNRQQSSAKKWRSELRKRIRGIKINK